MKTLKLSINCGDTTCASEPEKFCEYAATKLWGTQPWCALFNLPLEDTGWLQRLPVCMEKQSDTR